MSRNQFTHFWHKCRENNLRTLSGKFLRVGFCRPESWDFLGLCSFHIALPRAGLLHRTLPEDQPGVDGPSLCKDSKIEREYIPQNYHVNGQLMYYGILKSRIEYGDEGWRLRTGDNTTAVSKARKVSFLLGKSEWLVTGESTECSGDRESFSLQLKLTGCR